MPCSRTVVGLVGRIPSPFLLKRGEESPPGHLPCDMVHWDATKRNTQHSRDMIVMQHYVRVYTGWSGYFGTVAKFNAGNVAWGAAKYIITDGAVFDRVSCSCEFESQCSSPRAISVDEATQWHLLLPRDCLPTQHAICAVHACPLSFCNADKTLIQWLHHLPVLLPVLAVDTGFWSICGENSNTGSGWVADAASGKAYCQAMQDKWMAKIAKGAATSVISPNEGECTRSRCGGGGGGVGGGVGGVGGGGGGGYSFSHPSNLSAFAPILTVRASLVSC